MSHEELATLFHPPTQTAANDQFQQTEFKSLDAPAQLLDTENDGILLGQATKRGQFQPMTLGNTDRRRHLYIIGRTGVGKSTLLLQQLVSDICAGRGCGVIDPHGDLADSVLANIPQSRTNDVVVLDPCCSDFVVPFNPLACNDPTRRDLIVDDVLSAFSRIYDFAGTPRLTDTLRNALYVLVEKNLTLVDLLMLLADESYRRKIIANVEDELARMFWQNEFPSWAKTYRTEALSAVQNKVRPFLMNKRIRAMVGSRQQSFHLRQVMDSNQILVVNLSKGKLGETNAALLGSLIVSGIQQAALSRADCPEHLRRNFYLAVDEFQNFTTNSFATILSESRKYRLSLTVAHQYLSQLNQSTANAVFGNVGGLITFQIGIDDAERIATQLVKYPGQLCARDLTNLPKYNAYCRLLADGIPTHPFSLCTLPPPSPTINRRAQVINASHRHFGRPIEKINAMLQHELATR